MYCLYLDHGVIIYDPQDRIKCTEKSHTDLQTKIILYEILLKWNLGLVVSNTLPPIGLFNCTLTPQGGTVRPHIKPLHISCQHELYA